MLLSFLTNNKLPARDLGSAIVKSPILRLGPLGGNIGRLFLECAIIIIIMPHSLFKFLYFMIFFLVILDTAVLV